MSEVFEELATFIEGETGCPRDKISKETLLYHDVRVDGEDAMELMGKYSDKFLVDMSGFNFDLYFNGEGLDSLSIFGSIFGVGGNNHRVDEITVDMLMQAAINRKWN
ncbi:DUF1493 family protein [Marinomonas rhizomae]|uniref:DUF1493 family protein n=1 Tax=Marinomonas rhizomae TaxID=491948 RepID=UPI002105C4D5|nr:DUF1493 family protein [Marinomonas rhizomae]UTV99825.1 DUF1493 family protein [Marinomonas rhizomae]